MGYQRDKNATTAAISTTTKKKIDPGFPMPTGVVVAKLHPPLPIWKKQLPSLEERKKTSYPLLHVITEYFIRHNIA